MKNADLSGVAIVWSELPGAHGMDLGERDAMEVPA